MANEADILRSLNLGISKQNIGVAVNSNAEIILTSWVYEKIKIARKILAKRGTGSAAQSIQAVPIIRKGNMFEIKITADDYVDFLDKGVDGTQKTYGSPYSFKYEHPSTKMVEAIKGWNSVTGRRVPDNRYPKIKTYDQLAWATATAVKRHGIKPSPFMEIAFGSDSQDELEFALTVGLSKVVEVGLVDKITKTLGRKR